MQAIEYFTAGCREGTLLKHKLLCDEPETLDELLVTANSSIKAEIQVSATGKVALGPDTLSKRAKTLGKPFPLVYTLGKSP